jgi:hypothetical protein
MSPTKPAFDLHPPCPKGISQEAWEGLLEMRNSSIRSSASIGGMFSVAFNVLMRNALKAEKDPKKRKRIRLAIAKAKLRHAALRRKWRIEELEKLRGKP